MSGLHGRSSPTAYAGHTHTAQTRTHVVAYLLTTDGEGAGRDELLQAQVPVFAVPEDLKHMLSVLRLRGARRNHRRRRHEVRR